MLRELKKLGKEERAKRLTKSAGIDPCGVCKSVLSFGGRSLPVCPYLGWN